MPETNEEVIVAPQSNEGEGSAPTDESVSIPKKDYDALNQTLGSLKRELKDLKKAKEEPKETPTTNQPDDVLLQRVERLAIKTAGIDHPEDVELARTTAKKWGMDIEEVLADEDFKLKLDKQQSTRANVEATSGVRGSGSGATQAKLTTEYWQAKGTPPSPADVPDASKRREIIRGMLKASKGNGKMKFYNN